MSPILRHSIQSTTIITWLLIGNNYNFQSQSRTFSIPDNIPNGQFTLVARGTENGKNVSSSKVLIVNNKKTNINETSITKPIKNLVYPNPAKDNITLRLDKNVKTYRLNIKDISGKTVLTKYGVNNGDLHLDTSKLKCGLYLIEVFTDGNKTKSTKLVIQ